MTLRRENQSPQGAPTIQRDGRTRLGVKWWKVCGLLIVAGYVAGCGGNSTPVAVSVTPTTASVIVNGPIQFAGAASGANVTTVFWEICTPPTTSGQLPTNCTQPIGPSGCTVPTQANPLAGFGTITATGLYTAPSSVPPTNPFLVVAISCFRPTVFATATVTVLTGVRIQITPPSAAVGTQERFTFTATVTGTADQSVTWSVNGVDGGDATDGFICPNPAVPVPPPCPPGTYVAPFPAPGGSVTVKATSGADPTQSASATVFVQTATDPVLTSIDPATAAQGSIQQDIFLNGASFFSTSTVLVAGTPVPTTFINGSLLRATIPFSLMQQVQVSGVQVQRQNLDVSGTLNLNIVPVRPAVISSSPDSVTQSAANIAVALTGGFFSLGRTLATFNGQGGAQGVTTTFVDTRHISVAVPSGAIATPGLYPITVQNLDAAAAGVPSQASVNLAVKPSPGSPPSSPFATIGVGTSPSAVAIDPILNLAVVANTGSNSVSLIDLASNTITATIPNVGNSPTSVAVDELLPAPHQHVALVVNNGDNTVAAIDLQAQTVFSTVSVAIGPAGTSPAAVAVGANPLTHHAVVAYQSTNVATILDLVPPTPQLNPPCATPPCVLATVGGNLTPLSTGAHPAIAIDPRVNWALITPGGGGTTNLVDLGRDQVANANPALPPIDPGRDPAVIGSLSITSTIQGVALNTETHQALLTDVNGTVLSTFSLLDDSVTSISFPVGELGYAAAGMNSLDNVGVAVNGVSNKAAVVDMETGTILQTALLAPGASPQAVAVAPALDEAVIVNQGLGSVSILRLDGGAGFNALQITQASPAITFAPAATDLTLTIEGAGFVQGTSKVLLDGVALGGTPTVSNSGREIVATVPANMLATARRYAVQVQNTGGASPVSNAIDLTVIQPVIVGNSPFGVAVDTDRDLAVVSNSADNTVSLVDLVTGLSIIPSNAESVLTGTSPEGVATIPRTGQAVVANNGSNDFTVIDVTGTNNSLTKALCGGCGGASGVAINQDTNTAAVASSLTSQVSFINLLDDTLGSSAVVDADPGALAIDPNPTSTTTSPLVAVATSSQTSSVDLVNQTSGGIAARINGFQVPSGVVFDPVNQVFLVANSLQNTVVIVDPNTFIASSVRVGINPTSLDYNFQASTLVTANHVSNTMTVLEYVCPPPANGGGSPCTVPRARLILGLGSSPQFSVAVDPKMNLAALVDQPGNRLLLVPLPH